MTNSDKTYFVYILANRKHGTLYVGVTNDLGRRVYEHRTGMVEGFSKKHKLHRLVYFETHQDIEAAIHREKTIKKWKRSWKANIIEQDNPDWEDLYPRARSG